MIILSTGTYPRTIIDAHTNATRLAETQQPTDPIVNAQALRKQFGDFVAVDGISFEVPRGQCIGLLGPNGAGKTTTMRMLMGLSTITDGELQVLGCNARNLSRAELARLSLIHI